MNRVNAADFGIPQRRERVIIIGGKREIVEEFEIKQITTASLEPQLFGFPQVIGVKDALDDLPEIEQSEDGSELDYRFEPCNPFQKLMRGYITPEEYLNSYS